MTKITPEAVKAARDEGEPYCLKCRAPRSAHPYRHPFQPSHTTTLEILAPDLATAYLAQAYEIERLRKRIKAADRLATACEALPWGDDWNWFWRTDMQGALDDYRATEGRG
jgi:hypothetical protein